MPPSHTFFCQSKMLLLKRNIGNNGNPSPETPKRYGNDSDGVRSESGN